MTCTVTVREISGNFVWQFQSTYFEFSRTNRFSRSWLLSTLADVMQQLKTVKEKLTEAQQELQHGKHDRLYEKMLASYDEWRTLAQARLQAPLEEFREREQGSAGWAARGRSRASRLSHLLEELRLC